MKHTIHFIVGIIVVCGFSAAFSSSLLFKHGNDAVFAASGDGPMWLANPPLVTSSSAPVGSHGLIFKHSGNGKLWTTSDNKVNTGGGEAQMPGTIPSGSLNLAFGVNAMTTIADDQIYQAAPPGGQTLTLTKEDYYMESIAKENDQTHTPLTQYWDFGDGRIDYTEAEEKKLFYLKDHLGSTREVISEEGTPVERVIYDAYGLMTDETILAGIEPNAKDKFTGKEFDKEGAYSENGIQGILLNYFGARYYDPDVGIFTITDPARQFWNLYSYTDGNPINLIDPKGKDVAFKDDRSALDWTIAYVSAFIEGDQQTLNNMNSIWDSKQLFIYATLNIDQISKLSPGGIDGGAFVGFKGGSKYSGCILAGMIGDPNIDIKNGFTVGIINHEVYHANNYLNGLNLNLINEELEARILQYNYWKQNSSPTSGTRIEAEGFLNQSPQEQQNTIKGLYGN